MGKQTSPKTAGREFLPENFDSKLKKDEGGTLMLDLIPLMERAWGHVRRSTNWTPIELQAEIIEFFKYCEEKKLKPAKAGLRLWLGLSQSTYWEWETNRMEKYGAISELIQSANAIMEMQYINRSEQYPTANLFLLKTKHGYMEETKVSISNTSDVKAEDVNSTIAKLGLDKTNS